MRYSCEITRALEADVVVIGGGTAGVFAAVAAAKTGAKTVLVEKNAVLGGTMTAAGVNFPGLFFAWGKQIIAGPCWESVERTISLGGGKMPPITFKPERHWHEQIRLNSFVYIHVLFDMCREAGVEVYCNTMLADAAEDEQGVTLILTDKSGLFAVRAAAAVDATGDANLTSLLGGAVEKSEVQQPATLHNHLSGYDPEDVSEREIEEKLPAAGLPSHITAKKIMGWLRHRKFDMHIPCVDADTSRGRTVLEQTSYAHLMKLYGFLRDIRGLQNLQVEYVAAETGVRETNHIVGKGTVTAEEYISGYSYPDSVCYAFYPIDLHVMHGIKQTYHAENVVGKIPFSALIPAGTSHLLCAGRCISSDTLANSAVRVEAVCMATGQAAGCAAALSAKNGTAADGVQYSILCDALRSIGAIVPE